MSIRCEGTVIYLEGSCAVEEAEILAGLLEENNARSVDLAACVHLHGALVQTLLVFRPTVQGAPEDVFIKDFIRPALAFTPEDRVKSV